jgi:benzylsuccinate CoA-transferase BbsE subunit
MPASSTPDAAIASRALTGRRVLELADEKGVYCGKLLADMGADVIKIERPGGDAIREIPPFWGSQPHPQRGLFFLYTNTSKRGVTLDVTSVEGQALLRRLAETADLLLETFPPGFLPGLGLGYGDLRELNPRLVFTSITDFGQTGPHRSFKSSDLVASALGGSMYVTGEDEDPPVKLAGSQAHMMASTFGAVSSMIALHSRYPTSAAWGSGSMMASSPDAGGPVSSHRFPRARIPAPMEWSI